MCVEHEYKKSDERPAVAKKDAFLNMDMKIQDDLRNVGQ